ncbi:asparagine synthase (glutamine-hydrolyzing) [Marinilabilia salmonicolor]|uniref:asparagine synthase (glutamine-hydrolyzing) n=1 Tax=Marinilabilia salmonicolor TaxID=989 RepID=UPI00029AD885|nr:asparagine synthase (glutamine-hydrolyzing) [Marinilabilia salmonicolor]
MCGITGILNHNNEPASEVLCQKMAKVLEHRGPDGEGVWTSGAVGMGHRRLAVLDLSETGNQPMVSRDGKLVLSYNGEIYNYRELREELKIKGYQFHGSSDTEVVLNALHCWGSEAILRFNGMFAFAAWFVYEQRLLLARDRYGIKPLYYLNQPDVFLFGSEIKAIQQHPAYNFKVSADALTEYFSFQNIFSDLTLFEGVRLLPAGHFMEVKQGQTDPETHKYWDFNFSSLSMSQKEAETELHRLFEQAVERQLASDVEVGAYLSGGMDSGGITCVASRKFKNLKSFTAGFDLSSASGLELNFDERERSEFLSNLYKTEHYEVVLKAGDMERVMPGLITHLEDLRVGQSYPNYYVSRLAGRFVKVCLSGAGGDELFAGYPWRYYHNTANGYSNGFADRYFKYWQRLVPDDYRETFFSSGLRSKVDYDRPARVFKNLLDEGHSDVADPKAYINSSLYFESKTFLHGLLLVEDKLSMAHGLETRLPFLDNDLVDFAMKVPVELKLRDWEKGSRINENDLSGKAFQFKSSTTDGKILLRQMLQRYVPEDYCNGRKQGFSAPDASWFKGESVDYIRRLLFDRDARLYEYIDADVAQKLMTDHLDGKENRRLLIWSLLSFEWWLRSFG